jgi:uncharacterized protein
VRNTFPSYSFLDSYKLSRYNIAVAYDEGGGLLYNSLSGARLAVPRELLTQDQLLAFEANIWPDEVPVPNEDILLLLTEHQFLVPHDVDELSYVEGLRRSYAHNSEVRRVTVILTRGCNLGCVYCFQDKEVGDSRANIDRVLQYLKTQIVPGGLLQVTWFGGEPTLRLKTIYELSDAIIPICQSEGTLYKATISTNGVLLNEERIDMLLERCVTRYQISLDGPQQVQELRRPSHNGKPTYSAIVTNIQRLVQRGAQVTVKVILDRDNYEFVPQLFRDLGEHDLLGAVKVAIQHTEAKFAATAYDKRFSSLEEFAKIKLQLLEILAQEGYKLSEPSLRPEFCAATSPYSTTIDMGGTMFRCGTEKENMTGHLSIDGQEILLTNVAYEEMFTKRRFAHAMCESCKVLPICGGGCTVAAERLAQRDICSFFRVGIKDYLLLLDKNRSPAAQISAEPLHSM